MRQSLVYHNLVVIFVVFQPYNRSRFSFMTSSVLRSNRSSAAASTLSTSGAMGLSEKTFLNPKKMTASKEVRDEKGPSLDDFDKEIEIYQVCTIVPITLLQSLPSPFASILLRKTEEEKQYVGYLVSSNTSLEASAPLCRRSSQYIFALFNNLQTLHFNCIRAIAFYAAVN